MSKILIVAAHPDDELLGCGGTIIEHIKKRDKVGIIIVSEGISSRGGLKKINEEKIKKLHSISKKISSSLKLNFIKSKLSKQRTHPYTICTCISAQIKTVPIYVDTSLYICI